MKSILVTGSDGFIGSHLVKKLYKFEEILDLVCVDKAPKRSLSWKLDVADEDFLYHLRDHNFDLIYHFGGPCSILQFKKDPFYCLDNSLGGFRNILRLAKICDARLIYPSSGNVYGSGEKYHSETDKHSPVNLYGLCKAWCENMAQDSSIDSVCLRIFCGYGPGEEMKGSLASVLYQFLSMMMRGESPVIWGDGSQMRDFIYIDDIIKGILASSTFANGPVINIASGFSYSYTYVISLINKILGADITPTFVDKPRDYVEKTFANNDLMKNVLKVEPRPLHIGIKQFIEHIDSKSIL